MTQIDLIIALLGSLRIIALPAVRKTRGRIYGSAELIP